MNEALAKMLEILPDRFAPFIEKHAELSDPEMKKKELIKYHSDMLSRLASHEQPKKEALLNTVLNASIELLNLYPDASDKEQIVIMAAVGYFIDEDDVNNDCDDEFGFDDDLAVINAAFLALDKHELIVR